MFQIDISKLILCTILLHKIRAELLSGLGLVLSSVYVIKTHRQRQTVRHRTIITACMQLGSSHCFSLCLLLVERRRGARWPMRDIIIVKFRNISGHLWTRDWGLGRKCSSIEILVVVTIEVLIMQNDIHKLTGDECWENKISCWVIL